MKNNTYKDIENGISLTETYRKMANSQMKKILTIIYYEGDRLNQRDNEITLYRREWHK